MGGRDGIFAGEDPFAILARWLDEAWQAEPSDANAAALATVDEGGLPDVRIVLVKDFEPDAVVFYTNYTSAKGREIEGAGKAALNFHWKSLGRQVRLRGPVTREEGAQADAYYRSRPLGSRHGAWASAQSQPLGSREELIARVAAIAAEKGEDPERPPHWGGYRLRPTEIEFWANGEFRLHDRFRWRRESPQARSWTVARLNP